MSDISVGSSADIIREGQLTLSPVAQLLQTVGHEMLDGGELTLVEAGIYSTCPEPVESFTDRLLRSRDQGIPLVEVTLVGPEAGYERVNREFGVDGRTIKQVLRASGVEQANHKDGVSQLEYEAVGLSMLRSDDMLKLNNEDMRINTFAQFGKFYGYDGGLTDLWGLPKGPQTSASYTHEDGTVMSPPDASPMFHVLNQAVIDLSRALRAESSITSTAEDVVDYPRLGPGVFGYLEA